MKKILTQENIVGFAVAVVAGLVAVALISRNVFPMVTKYVTGK